MFPKNAVIKIPMDPRDPQKAFKVMYELTKRGVRINATLGLTSGQLIGAAEAMRKNNGCFISLFWGRCEEAGGIGAGKTLMTVLKYLETHNLSSKVIIGSVRTVEQIDHAFALGAHIVTIKPELLEQWMFTKRGVETADEFNKAYRDIKERVTLI
jgi:transaldolase